MSGGPLESGLGGGRGGGPADSKPDKPAQRNETAPDALWDNAWTEPGQYETECDS